MHIALAAEPDGRVALTRLDSSGARQVVTRAGLPAAVAIAEAQHPRWVWDDTNRWYPPLLKAGVRVERCVDLRLRRAILRNSPLMANTPLADAPGDDWDQPAQQERVSDGLFDLDTYQVPDPIAEFRRQEESLTSGLGLLLAAESAGALVAAEIHYAGLPWRTDMHELLLRQTLGEQPRPGERPSVMEELVAQIRTLLNSPKLNPDSPVDLLKVLRANGIMVESTSKWQLADSEHAVIPPLLEYKRLARLLSANGWHWLEANVANGRFRPEYVVGGVVTGRWASRGGGGALQLPRAVRGAVIADPGWKLVVADASQLEPRILAGLARDHRMIDAGTAGDLYAGIVAQGALATRDDAKIAMLGAMYGATTGNSGRLMPALTRAFPRAIELVEQAARAGERGQRVSTLLGRGSPAPEHEWQELQAHVAEGTATDADQKRARTASRSWGRFTRNFVVQGTAAEWALCWMASLRRSLYELSGGAWLTQGPHLVFLCTTNWWCTALPSQPIQLSRRFGTLLQRRDACFSTRFRCSFLSPCRRSTIMVKPSSFPYHG